MLRDRVEVARAAGPNQSVEQLKLEVLLDIRDLLQELIAQGKTSAAVSQPQGVHATSKKESLGQKFKEDLKKVK